eukprot:TRINITY_DN21219_c0_g1_i1.p2 TRINITY_DN21219_c0_g1~~TRINITY_DN21219_c0_g1_i1.p2  ORF type:complete len:166 (+),score=10.37 TRINITY_DN21219_c0_g1_i1:128-625(+)
MTAVVPTQADAKDAVFKKGSEWSTGLFGCFDDGWIFIFGMLAPCALAVNSSTHIYGGACCGQGLVKKVTPCMNACGCKETDGGLCVNFLIACCFSSIAMSLSSFFGIGTLLMPCPYCCWRAKLRGDKNITGSMITDYFVYCCLFPCAAMQEAREVKAMGKAYTSK